MLHKSLIDALYCSIKDKSDAFHHTAGISIAVLIFVHEVTNALNAFTFGL